MSLRKLVEFYKIIIRNHNYLCFWSSSHSDHITCYCLNTEGKRRTLRFVPSISFTDLYRIVVLRRTYLAEKKVWWHKRWRQQYSRSLPLHGIKQFVVTNCSKERSGSIVNETLKNGILIIIGVSKESDFYGDLKYMA